MTADEMFQKLGYSPSPICVDDKDTIFRYFKEVGPETLAITVYTWGVEATVEDPRLEYTGVAAMTTEEIRAVAKLLEEMEADNESTSR